MTDHRYIYLSYKKVKAVDFLIELIDEIICKKIMKIRKKR